MINVNNNLKHELMAIRFSMWDLHLYLDTHKDCENARSLMETYKQKYERLLRDYIATYGPLTATGCDGDKWLAKPFPWVLGGEC